MDEVGKVKGDEDRVVVRVDPAYFRPTEVDLLIGDPSKAKKELGWECEIKFHVRPAPVRPHRGLRLEAPFPPPSWRGARARHISTRVDQADKSWSTLHVCMHSHSCNRSL